MQKCYVGWVSGQVSRRYDMDSGRGELGPIRGGVRVMASRALGGYLGLTRGKDGHSRSGQ